ncbi:F-box protein At5g07610-like [Salvia hispanica]|uniref:F-box protein At5g07610-like n=1 Tax=Salvia hispanica TaxID=49212 RepID=UPI002009C81E|nr:F-box protein At5g07610-like [Salvia hispanica]
MNSETLEEDYGDRWLGLAWNHDLLTEILVLLPAKSVTRCKLVCKHWLSLISSDKFCHLHTLRCPELRPSLLLNLKTPGLQFFNFSPIMNGEKMMNPYTFSVPNPIIVSSCNGLMLLKTHWKEESFHVYNSTTKLSRKLRFPVAHSDNYPYSPYTVTLALAFDPSESPHYKVVCIRSTTDRRADPDEIHTYRIDVYDSQSRAWKLRMGSFMFPGRLHICGGGMGVYWNGLIYWEVPNEIRCYDIARNEFKTLSLPNYPPIPIHPMTGWIAASCLQEANGHLYQSRVLTVDNRQLIVLFELEMDDDRSSSWLLRYDETISQHERTPSYHSYALQLRLIKGSHGIETCSVVSCMSGKISVYSFLDKSSKLLVDLTGQPFDVDEDDVASDLQMYEYVECLAVV